MNPAILVGTFALLGLLQDASEGQRLLQQNRPDEARAVFERILAKAPDNVDALVGAGFAALRQNRTQQAMPYFRKALALSPSYADAAYGLALCEWRLGHLEEARRFAQEALRLNPKNEEARTLLVHMPEPLRPVPPAPQRPAELQVPFRTTATAFQIREASSYRTVFLKGVNLGAALPGHFATEFPSKEVYQGWFKEMEDLGINVLRIYTIHPPAFYEALREHNLHAEHPIYLLHGLWVEPPPGDDFDDPAWFGDWKSDMRHMVDVLHGRASFAPRPGYTGGNYRADVSPWWIGTILGREWEPFNVVAFNKLHPGLADWKGRYLEIQGGNATEVFMGKAMDAFIAIEDETYHTQRPVAFSNWPTLDPITHPSETPFMEEQQLRKKLGLPYVSEVKNEVYDDDSVALDMEKYRVLEAYQGGLFASYHIYPNYPEFINLDPSYNRARDAEGPNNYFGYLLDLRRYHKKYPVLVSEFGISDSRITAHWQPQGMTHGGLDEKAQARMLPRLARNIYDAGYAGCVVFAWMDEWFKKTWQVSPIESPLERKPLWFNAMDAEENYGLIGIQPGAKGPSIPIDGHPEHWKTVPTYQKNQNLELKLLADEGWLHVGLFWKGPRPDWNKERFVLGLDTFDPALGNHQLPFGVPARSATGLEFAVELSGDGCEVYVDAPYDYSPHRRFRPYRSIAHEDGPWRQMESETNRLRVGRDGTVYPPRRYELGTLRKGTMDRRDPAFDSNAEWNEGPGFLEVRIPWSLLLVTDPSSRRVLQDPPNPVKDSPLGTTTTDGIRACLVRLAESEPGRYAAVDTLPALRNGEIPLPPLFTWETWEHPRWHAFHKLAFDAMKAAFAALPEAPGPIPAVTPQIEPAPAPAPRQPFRAPGRELNQLLEDARKARDEKNWMAAIKAYDAVLAKDPAREVALFERAQTLGWAGRYAEAIEAWQTFKARIPGRTAEADRNLAEVAGWGRNFPLALRTLQPYVDQGERWAVLNLITVGGWAGDYRPAEKLAAFWLQAHPEDDEIRLAQARILSWDSRLKEAQGAYRQLLKSETYGGDARTGLAQIAVWRGHFEEARAEFRQMPKDRQQSSEGKLLDAQILRGEGKEQQSAEQLRDLARTDSSAKTEAEELLRSAADGSGPMMEMGASRMDSSDDLRNDESYVRTRVPFQNGSFGVAYQRHASALAPDETAPHAWTVSLAQPFGPVRFEAEVGRLAGLAGDPASTHRLEADWRMGRGVTLTLSESRDLIVSTPTATKERIGVEAWTAGFGWTGFTDTIQLEAGTGRLSAGNRRTTWSASYEHRWRVSPFTLGAGLTSRSLAYSESLPLGFWNPEHFRFHGITGSAAFERSRFSVSLSAQLGRQLVDEQGWSTGWGYGLDWSWGIGHSPYTLFGGWSASTSAINAASASEADHYREHTVRFGLRITGLR